MNTSLIVFAKKPVPGKVKTRLIPHITPEKAAELYEAFFVDLVNKIKNNIEVVDLAVAYTPAYGEKVYHELIGSSVNLFPQRGDNLGERMKNAFEATFARGAKRVVIIGTDSPTLPISYIQKAFHVLKNVPIVVGPTFDGGYYLIGLSEFNGEIFNDIRWGTSEVFHQTLIRIKTLNKQLFVLPPWYDIDTPFDLEFLRSHILAMSLSGFDIELEKTEGFLGKLNSHD